MLKLFRVNNFKSLVNCEFRPVGLNLLIGPNNAGKTNLCSAMRFLGLTSSYPLEEALRMAGGETWNVTNVYVNDPTVTMEVECELDCEKEVGKGTKTRDGFATEGAVEPDKERLAFSYRLVVKVSQETPAGRRSLSVVEESLTATGSGFMNTPLLTNTNGNVALLHEQRFLQKQPSPAVATSAPTDATMLYRLFDLTTNRRSNIFKRYMQSWSYYSLNPADLRSSKVVKETPGLLSDGGNLIRALYTLHMQNPRLEKNLIEAVRTLEPKLEFFTFQSPDPDSVFLFMEDKERHRFGTQGISDGTLRFMAITYLLGVAADADGAGPRGLTIIEEPENGLYVGHLKPIFKGIDAQGKAGQYILTSHNPYFIDLFDGHLEGVHLVKAGKPSSEIRKPNIEKVRKLLDEYALGELYFREMLL